MIFSFRRIVGLLLLGSLASFIALTSVSMNEEASRQGEVSITTTLAAFVWMVIIGLSGLRLVWTGRPLRWLSGVGLLLNGIVLGLMFGPRLLSLSLSQEMGPDIVVALYFLFGTPVLFMIDLAFPPWRMPQWARVQLAERQRR